MVLSDLQAGPCAIFTDEMGRSPALCQRLDRNHKNGQQREGFHTSGSKLGAGGLPALPVKDCCRNTICTNYSSHLSIQSF